MGNRSSQFLLIILILSIYSKITFQYTITSNCNSCLSTSTNKFCSPYEDSSTGYCCDSTNESDFCGKNNRYLCSDVVNSNSMKLYLCPTSQSKCFSTSTSLDFDQNQYSKIIYAGDQARQLGGTTLEFTKDDVCSWRIIASSQYVQNKLIRITINQLYQTNCYINSGESIKSTNGEISCSQSTQYDFDADKSVFIIGQAQTQGAVLHFTYQLVDRITFTQVAIMYSIGVAVFIILAGFIAILTVRFVILMTIKKNHQTWQNMTIEMKNLVENAQKQKDFSKAIVVEDVDQQFANTNSPVQTTSGGGGDHNKLLVEGVQKKNNQNANRHWTQRIEYGPTELQYHSKNNSQFNLY